MIWTSPLGPTAIREPWHFSIAGLEIASGTDQVLPPSVERDSSIWLPPAANKRVQLQYTLPPTLSAATQPLSRKSVVVVDTITGSPKLKLQPLKLPRVTAIADVTELSGV